MIIIGATYKKFVPGFRGESTTVYVYCGVLGSWTCVEVYDFATGPRR